MANRNSTRGIVQSELDSQPDNYTTGYLRRLIAERGQIRAALYNHGGSIITHGSSLDLEGQDVYSSQIGNDFHVDLVEAERIMVAEMTPEQRDILLAWADGISEEEAASLVRVKPGGALRMRRKRAIERLTDRMQDDTGRGSREPAESAREEDRNETT